jgi:hypothetical protein
MTVVAGQGVGHSQQGRRAFADEVVEFLASLHVHQNAVPAGPVAMA